MGCNTRAAFSSWVYKNIYKIVSIYDSAWRSGADVSLKPAAAESFRMVPKLTFIRFWKKSVLHAEGWTNFNTSSQPNKTQTVKIGQDV